MPQARRVVRPMGCAHWPVAKIERETAIPCRDSGNGLATDTCGIVYLGVPTDRRSPAPSDVPLPIGPVAAAVIVALAMAGGLCLWAWLFARMLS